MLKVIIVEDSALERKRVVKILGEHCKNVDVVAEAEDVKSAVSAIRQHVPDLVLLDIKLPDGTAFDILEELKPIFFNLFFITAYEEYAVKAFKFSAIDYILKPVDAKELIEAVKKAESAPKQDLTMNIKTLESNIKPVPKAEKKIVLKTFEKIQVVDVKDIIRCEADDCYTKFYLINNKSITVSNTMKEYEELLKEYGFFRVHNSHLINLDFVDSFVKKDGSYVVMKDQSQIPVSQRKKESFLSMFENL